ncbi:MAG: BrnT family toxin [Burkholderiales bacterium]|nr:BrnT family toxin [Burkholderiales bacterium]
MPSYDPRKSAANLRKHGHDLPACEEALDGPMLTREDRSEVYGEQRFVSLGLAMGKVVVLVWTDREDGPRLISCRDAERHEQKACFRAYPKC